MMYVLSFYSNGLFNIVDGVYGVFDSEERAQDAVKKFCDYFGETILDIENDPLDAVRVYYSTKGKYVLEKMPLNDLGCV